MDVYFEVMDTVRQEMLVDLLIDNTDGISLEDFPTVKRMDFDWE